MRGLMAALATGTSGPDAYELFLAKRAAEAVADRARFEAFDPALAIDPCPASSLYHERSCLPDALVHADPEEIAALTRRPDAKRYPDASRVPLAPPAPVTASLSDLLRARASSGEFTGVPLPLRDVGTILGWSVGITDPRPEPQRRAVPSAGALHALETYVLAFAVDGLNPGLLHYDPAAHELEVIGPVAGAPALWPALAPGFRGVAPSYAVAITARLRRIQTKYGERAYRFAHLEAGHCVQNVLLLATALGSGSVPVGGFADDELSRLLNIDVREEVALYLVLIGDVRRSRTRHPEQGA